MNFLIKKIFHCTCEREMWRKGSGLRNMGSLSQSRAGFKTLLVYQTPSRCRLNFFHPTCRNPFLPHCAWQKRDCSRTFARVVDGKPFVVKSIEFVGCDLCHSVISLPELGRKLKVLCLRSLLRPFSGLGPVIVSSKIKRKCKGSCHLSVKTCYAKPFTAFAI